MCNLSKGVMEKGVAKGRAEGKKEVAEKLLKEGFLLSKIAALTGLSEKEINRLRSS